MNDTADVAASFVVLVVMACFYSAFLYALSAIMKAFIP